MSGIDIGGWAIEIAVWIYVALAYLVVCITMVRFTDAAVELYRLSREEKERLSRGEKALHPIA